MTIGQLEVGDSVSSSILGFSFCVLRTSREMLLAEQSGPSQVAPSVVLFLWDYAPARLLFEPGPQPEAGPHSESESEAGEPESEASSPHNGPTAP